MSEVAMGFMPDREGQRMDAKVEINNAQQDLKKLMEKPTKTWVDHLNIGFLHIKIAMLNMSVGNIPGKMS